MEIALSFFQLLHIHLHIHIYIYIQEGDFYIILMVLIGTPCLRLPSPTLPNGMYSRKRSILQVSGDSQHHFLSYFVDPELSVGN